LPILLSFFRQQILRPEYQAFPIMLVAAAVFLSLRLQQAKPVDRATVWTQGLAWSLAVIAWLLLSASFWVFSPWLAMVAFVVYCLAIAITIWQYWQINGLWGIWLLIALLVPPPLDRDQMLIERLQLFSSRVTSLLLDSIGVLHVSQGNILTLSDRQLFVDEACSGIVSLISIVYCIAIYSLWQYRSFIHFGLLVVVGVGWTVLMNSLRLIVISLGWAWYEVDLIEGWPHTVLGLVIFAISAGVIFAVDRFLLALLAPINILGEGEGLQRRTVGGTLVRLWNGLIASGQSDEGGEEPSDSAADPVLPRQVARTAAASYQQMMAQTSVFGYPMTLALGTLGLSYLVFFLPSEQSQQANINQALKRALDLDQDAPISPGEDWEVLNFSSDRREIFRWDNWGQYSRTYNLRDQDGYTYQLSCDFMFGPHWHDLRACYRGSGWKIDKELVLYLDKLPLGPQAPVTVESSLTSEPVVEQFTIRRVPDVLDGLITYGAFRANGKWFNRPRGQGLWQDFVAHVVQGRDRAEQADYFQVQVTTYYEGQIPPVQKQRAEWLLHHGIQWFQDYLVPTP
jgi:exosortase